MSFSGSTRVVDLPDLKEMVQGDTLELHCRTQGYPEPKIVWIIGKLTIYSQFIVILHFF